jgi:hypothetical protein
MKILIQVWQNQKIVSEFDYEPEVNQMETVENFADLLHGLDVGEGFTLMADRIA